MTAFSYIEDIFVEFYDYYLWGLIEVDRNDSKPIDSFYNTVTQNKPLTQNQGNLLIKLLIKYQKSAENCGLHYQNQISNPQWKQPFRVLDLSKKIFIEQDDSGDLWVCAKFPFQLKTEFDNQFVTSWADFNWDGDSRLRRNLLYDTNLIKLYEFAQNHKFEIDDDFLSVIAEIEEIWQNQENITPVCQLINNQVELLNCDIEAKNFFDLQKNFNVINDLFLAKSMGFVLDKKPENLAEKIAVTDNNQFWLKSFDDFFSLIDNVDGKVCVILDRADNLFSWLTKFSEHSENYPKIKENIRVCFREEKTQETGINEWIKIKGYGGKVDNAKVLIFNHKPAKWLFKDIKSVKIIATAGIYPSTNLITKSLLETHPCVLYLGDVKPSEIRNRTIVEL